MIRGPHKQPGFVAASLHRLSGIALAIFVPFHFLVLATALDGADALDSILSLTDSPLMNYPKQVLSLRLRCTWRSACESLPLSFSAFANAQYRRFRPVSALRSRSGSPFC